VVAELVLAGVASEETIQICVSGTESESGRPPARAYEPRAARLAQGSPVTGLPAIKSRSALVGLRDFLTSSPTFSKELAVTMMRRRDHDVRWELAQSLQ